MGWKEDLEAFGKRKGYYFVEAEARQEGLVKDIWSSLRSRRAERWRWKGGREAAAKGPGLESGSTPGLAGVGAGCEEVRLPL